MDAKLWYEHLNLQRKKKKRNNEREKKKNGMLIFLQVFVKRLLKNNTAEHKKDLIGGI